MFWMTGYLALFGALLIPASFLMGWIMLFFPESKPDILNIPNKKEDPMAVAWNMLVISTGMISEPILFMMTQLLTWGQSDLRDFALIYMDAEEAFIYFMINTVFMTMQFPFAVVWMAGTFWIYGIIICWKSIKWIFSDGPGRGGKGKKWKYDKDGDSSDDDDMF